MIYGCSVKDFKSECFRFSLSVYEEKGAVLKAGIFWPEELLFRWQRQIIFFLLFQVRKKKEEVKKNTFSPNKLNIHHSREGLDITADGTRPSQERRTKTAKQNNNNKKNN